MLISFIIFLLLLFRVFIDICMKWIIYIYLLKGYICICNNKNKLEDVSLFING